MPAGQAGSLSHRQSLPRRTPHTTLGGNANLSGNANRLLGVRLIANVHGVLPIDYKQAKSALNSLKTVRIVIAPRPCGAHSASVYHRISELDSRPDERHGHTHRTRRS